MRCRFLRSDNLSGFCQSVSNYLFDKEGNFGIMSASGKLIFVFLYLLSEKNKNKERFIEQ